MRDRVVGTVKSQRAFFASAAFWSKHGDRGREKDEEEVGGEGEDQREWAAERRRGRILKRRIAAEGALEREASKEQRRLQRLDGFADG